MALKYNQKVEMVQWLMLVHSGPAFFLYCQNVKLKFKKIQKKWFEKFSVTKSEEKRDKIARLVYVGFHCVAKNIEAWLKICALFVVYSQHLLNLPKHDRHFGYNQISLSLSLSLSRAPSHGLIP
jgi:hypothetical protein